MKKIFFSAAALLFASLPASGQPNEKSISGPIDHQETRNGRQQPDRTRDRAMTPEMMSEMAQLLRQTNSMIQKASDTLEHKESLDQPKMAELSRMMDELSGVMREMSDQIGGRADPAGLRSLKGRIDKLYAGMAAL